MTNLVTSLDREIWDTQKALDEAEWEEYDGPQVKFLSKHLASLEEMKRKGETYYVWF